MQTQSPIHDPGVLRIAVLPGDGIGPEVTAESLRVLRKLKLERPECDLSFVHSQSVPASIWWQIRGDLVCRANAGRRLTRCNPKLQRGTEAL